MNKQKLFAITSAISILSLAPLSAGASTNQISAKSYVVTDVQTGNIIMGENTNITRAPASLTKLVTAMVVMDAKVKLNKEVAMTASDQKVGECSNGGICIKTKTGVKFSVDELFHATLMRSANNAASALSRSVGLTPAKFAARMNAKVKALGATHSHFYEPTGMSARNVVTSADYAKIVAAAFKYPYLSQVSQTESFTLTGSNPAYNQTVKNINTLLTSGDVDTVGAKTGYIGSVSGYNFGAVFKTSAGKDIAVVVLGEPHMYTAYADAKTLVKIVEGLQVLALR